MAVPARNPKDGLPAVMSAADARAMFDDEARRIAGVSGDEFLRRWDAGEYADLDDTPEGRSLSCLAMLIPFGRQDA